jgi:hypothetical protein
MIVPHVSIITCTMPHGHIVDICTMHIFIYAYMHSMHIYTMHICTMARPRNTHRTRAGLGAWRRLEWIGGGRICAHVALTLRKMLRIGKVFVPPISLGFNMISRVWSKLTTVQN